MSLILFGSLLLLETVLPNSTNVAINSTNTPQYNYEQIQDEWSEFKKIHQKQYTNPREESYRFRVFIQNQQFIKAFNNNPTNNYKLKLNRFADLMNNEYVEITHGLNTKPLGSQFMEATGSSYLRSSSIELPEEVDWRKQGYVTPVKDQRKCGSCWAFSATGALEGQNFRKTGKLISLSEQNLVDCSREYGNDGCDGGYLNQAFQYIKDNDGIDTETSYPYEARDGACRFKKQSVGATDSGFVDLPSGDERALQEAVATIGPIAVSIDASEETFQFYANGIYDNPLCSSENLGHAVLLVGYGTQNGLDYWLIKNSWGTEWGDDGYVKIARNKNNLCGISTQASYPLV